METTRTRGFVDKVWDGSILPTLIDYIRIPNKSPLFDPEWQVHGYMDRRWNGLWPGSSRSRFRE